ncbi:SpaH/EbpB family LPXTG-anchored major pilin [Puerhibacterium puerhi]|uniref:SpaH/EbpB family LPXTG-anchored major pilin n=1 Tax=Puerhibacterium puerhi TaxID=2692623 RepID=UPI00135CC8F9|nr:SpaH/EbpB family LPXTG-anchored major pilin [Puerhibacterium puerhi]
MFARPAHRLRRVAAVLAGLTLAGLGMAGPAAAATSVDPSATGTLTVHKLERPEAATGLDNDGTPVDTTGLEPLAGVEFTVQQVGGVDLSTNAGWSAANALSGSFDAADPAGSIAAAGHSLLGGTSVTTGADGTAVFSRLPVGLYLVTETSYPAGVTPSAPFLVTLPLTDPDDSDAWLYDVHVYPKNSVSGATKTVTDSGAVALGDEVSWTITGDIPNEDVIDGYKIVDALDAKLTYGSATVRLADGTPVTAGTHYTVSHDAGTHALTVEFTEAGRAVLAAHHDTQVVVQVVTTVNTVGEIENTALLYPNRSSFDVEPGRPGGPTETPEVQTKWGGLTLQKVNPAGDALSGAVFAVYTSEADARAGRNPVTLGGRTEFPVAADGTLTLTGLRYSDFANGQQVAPGDEGYRAYWIAELKAPAGYELLAEPVQFEVTAATSAAGIDLEVENVPSNAGFALPLTGGVGTTLLSVAGALILGGALFLAVRGRRRAEAA